ncbi:unnamed protein product [Knipowitschia caucasica]|uniref:Uncharacterized protein n=1 Tax=Knipowitschia caucasica TaxID=637954 RepID=A0AAV2J3B0_KNICA
MEKLRTNSLRQKEASLAPPSLPVYVDVLPGGGPQPGCIYPQLPITEAPRMCPQHNQPLELFCHEDRECVCALCRQYGHKGHRVVHPTEERRHRQEELVQMQQEVQHRVQLTEKTLKEIPHVTKQHKALVQALQSESSAVFSELVKAVEGTGARVAEVLGAQEESLSSRVEGTVQRLQQEVARLHWRSEELSRLADMQDHICFLKNFFLLEPLGQAAVEPGLGHQEAAVSAARSTLRELQASVENQCKAALTKIQALAVNDESPTPETSDETATVHNVATSQTGPENTALYEIVLPDPVAPLKPHVEASAPPPPLPPPPPPRPHVSTLGAVGSVNYEPKSREEMLKYRFVPTMDHNTAHRHLQLSDGGRKATLKAENMNYPDCPERFQFWRQVLCSQALGGSPYYWEVEWTGTKVTIAVAFKELERGTSDDGSRLGHNPQSWSLYWSGTGFSFWHNNQEKLLGSPKAKRVGVYLDQHAGVLAFYRISKLKAYLIHRHQQDFTGPLHPGFRAGLGSTISICELD